MVNEPGDDDDEEEFEQAEIERLFAESKHVVEGYYGIDAITHCCLEPHGTTLQWNGSKLDVHLSTQNVSRTDDGFADALEITADDVDVHCEYIGGGFGSKFKPDYWGIAAAENFQSDRSSGQADVGPKSRTKDRWQPTVGLYQGSAGRRREWIGSRLGFTALGNDWLQWGNRQRQYGSLRLSPAQQSTRGDRHHYEQ